MTNDSTVTIAPWLSVADATAAVDFYIRAFGAEEREVLRDDDLDQVVVAQLAVGNADFWVQDDPDLPASASDGEPIPLILSVADPDAASNGRSGPEPRRSARSVRGTAGGSAG